MVNSTKHAIKKIFKKFFSTACFSKLLQCRPRNKILNFESTALSQSHYCYCSMSNWKNISFANYRRTKYILKTVEIERWNSGAIKNSIPFYHEVSISCLLNTLVVVISGAYLMGFSRYKFLPAQQFKEEMMKKKNVCRYWLLKKYTEKRSQEKLSKSISNTFEFPKESTHSIPPPTKCRKS